MLSDCHKLGHMDYIWWPLEWLELVYATKMVFAFLAKMFYCNGLWFRVRPKHKHNWTEASWNHVGSEVKTKDLVWSQQDNDRAGAPVPDS